eukprot:6178185-Pleurochrysis_carterae.AAC.5
MDKNVLPWLTKGENVHSRLGIGPRVPVRRVNRHGVVAGWPRPRRYCCSYLCSPTKITRDTVNSQRCELVEGERSYWFLILNSSQSRLQASVHGCRRFRGRRCARPLLEAGVPSGSARHLVAGHWTLLPVASSIRHSWHWSRHAQVLACLESVHYRLHCPGGLPFW